MKCSLLSLFLLINSSVMSMSASEGPKHILSDMTDSVLFFCHVYCIPGTCQKIRHNEMLKKYDKSIIWPLLGDVVVWEGICRQDTWLEKGRQLYTIALTATPKHIKLGKNEYIETEQDANAKIN